MLQVDTSGTNYFSLKGDYLVTGTIARHAQGWTVRLVLKLARNAAPCTVVQERERLHPDAMIPTLREILGDYGIMEEVNAEEIKEYMEHAESVYTRTCRTAYLP